MGGGGGGAASDEGETKRLSGVDSLSQQPFPISGNNVEATVSVCVVSVCVCICVLFVRVCNSLYVL